MKAAVVGSGTSGLAAARCLARAGVEVDIYESADAIGGLAGSIDVAGVPLERYYHHIFKSDERMVELIDDCDLSDQLIWSKAPTGVFDGAEMHAFSTPMDILRFSPLSFVSRVRLGAASAFLKVDRRGHKYANQTALDWSRRWMGKQATEQIWEPLLVGKFGDRAEEISMAWLWARIHSRTFELGYLRGGFSHLYETLAVKLQDEGVSIHLNTPIRGLKKARDGAKLVLDSGETVEYDAVVLTAQQPTNERIMGMESGAQDWQRQFVGATCFILELDRTFMPYYWLNIAESSAPVLAVVEHTRFSEELEYNGRVILYVGNYVETTDHRYTEEPEVLLSEYCTFLSRINPDFTRDWILNWHFSKAPFAQPVMTTDYKGRIPDVRTARDRVFVGTMAQVYPFDRGQNYAIQTGESAASEALKAMGLI